MRCERWETTPHHAVPSQEVRDDFFLDIVHQSSCALVVVSSVNQELFTGVLVNQRADLKPWKQFHLLETEKVNECLLKAQCCWLLVWWSISAFWWFYHSNNKIFIALFYFLIAKYYFHINKDAAARILLFKFISIYCCTNIIMHLY